MSTYFISFKGITKHYPTMEEAVRMALFCGLRAEDVKESHMAINWK